MKVLIDHQLPFLLAHGGLQIQIEQAKAALEEACLEVECLHWWDPEQRGDITRLFGCATLPSLKHLTQFSSLVLHSS